MGMIPAKKVFLSSTTKDLWQYRAEAGQLIKKINQAYQNKFQLVEVTMDTEALDGERIPALDRSRKWVREECDWLVSIIAWNYGYVPPGETRSVTEWEYWEGVESGKPCFVFLAGEVGDGEKKYRALGSDVEKENLADWKSTDLVASEHAQALTSFKTKLREKDFRIFANIQHFLQQLEDAFKKRIELELKQQPEAANAQRQDTQYLVELMKLKDQIQNCLQQVEQLAGLKQIHDRLHQIRQFGIRRWREEVSMQWQDGPMSDTTKVTYLLGLLKIKEARGELSGYAHNLPEQADLANLQLVLGKVLETEFLDQPADKQAFDHITHLYAARVQSAFVNANGTMLLKANNMTTCLFDAASSGESDLKADDKLFLKEVVQALNDGHAKVQRLFNKHNDWQGMHDQLERIDQTKGSSLFVYDLEGFLDNPERVAGVLQHAKSVAEHCDYQTDWSSKIAAVERHFADLQIDRSEATYERMRKAFDDLFFDVDKDTLKKVERAAHCARQYADNVGAQWQLANRRLGANPP